MGDKIYIDTELLRQISSQLSQVHHSLSAVHQKLGGSVSEVRGVVSDQVGLINVLSSVQGNTQKAADYTERLAKAVNNAAARWEEVERRLANQQIQGSEAAPQGAGGVAGTGAATWMDAHKATWMGAMIGTALGGPFGIGIGMGIGAAIDAGYGPAMKSGLNTAYDFLTGKTDFEYSTINAEAKNGNYSAKEGWGNLSFKTKGQAGFDYENKEWEDWDKKSGNIGISGGVESEVNLYQLEGSYRSENVEVSAKNSYFGIAGSGEMGLTLFKDGKFDPEAGAKAKVEVYTTKSELSGKYGSDDLNVFGGTQITTIGAGAEGSIGITKDDKGNWKAGVSGEAEAYWAKGEIKTGIDLYGFKIGVSGEAMVGVTGSVGAEVGPSSASGNLGLGPFKGKIMVDWAEFAQKHL